MKSHWVQSIWLLACFTLMIACNRSPGFPDVPEINFISITPRIVHDNDSVSVTFGFKDGNGDIGRASTDTIAAHSDIVFYDNRISNRNLPKDSLLFRIVDITPFGKIKAVSGTIRIAVHGVFRRPGFNTDSLSYTVKMKDRAGHWSNSFSTSKVVILP